MKYNKKRILKVTLLVCMAAITGFALYLLITHYQKKENFRLNFVSAVKEQFTGTPTTTSPLGSPDPTISAEDEEALLAQTPDSAFRFKNYFLERPPTHSSQTRVEFSNTLPEGVLVGDLNMSTSNKFNIASVNAGGDQSNEYTLQAHGQDSNDRTLRLSMKDDNNKSKAFEVWGASCTAQGDCTQPGVKMHKMSDAPSYEIYDHAGGLKHKLDAGGTASHGKLNIAGGKHILHPSGNQFSDGVVNANDVNVRGRLYFSQAGSNENPRTAGGNRFIPVHNSDPFYIEKETSRADVHKGNSTLKIVMLDDQHGDDAIEIRSGGNGARRVMRIANNGEVTIDGPLNVNGELHISGGTSIGGGLTVNGGTHMGGGLHVTGGQLQVRGELIR